MEENTLVESAFVAGIKKESDLVPTKKEFGKMLSRQADYAKNGKRASWISTPWGLANSIKDVNKTLRYYFIAKLIGWDELAKALLSRIRDFDLDKDDMLYITKTIWGTKMTTVSAALEEAKADFESGLHESIEEDLLTEPSNVSGRFANYTSFDEFKEIIDDMDSGKCTEWDIGFVAEFNSELSFSDGSVCAGYDYIIYPKDEQAKYALTKWWSSDEGDLVEGDTEEFNTVEDLWNAVKNIYLDRVDLSGPDVVPGWADTYEEDDLDESVEASPKALIERWAEVPTIDEVCPTKEDYDTISKAFSEFKAHADDEAWKRKHFKSMPWGIAWMDSAAGQRKMGKTLTPKFALQHFIIASIIKWKELKEEEVRALQNFGGTKEDMRKLFDQTIQPNIDRIMKAISGMKESIEFKEDDFALVDLDESAKLSEKIEKHDTLNTKLWNEDNTLKPEVIEKINEIVTEFTKRLEDDEIKFKVKDIKLVGSNCSYNYNDDSDLDVHIVMDTDSLECPDNLYPLLYSAYRSLFNGKLDIDFYGIPVEIFVETDDTEDMNAEISEEELTESKKQLTVDEAVRDSFKALTDLGIGEPTADDIIEDIAYHYDGFEDWKAEVDAPTTTQKYRDIKAAVVRVLAQTKIIEEEELTKGLTEARQQSAVKSNGVYSVMNNAWIKEPVAEDIPDIDQVAVDAEVESWASRYDSLILKANEYLSKKATGDGAEADVIQEIDDYIQAIYQLRKDSIATDGEYGMGNLVFKELRSAGELDTLKDLKNQLKSQELSLSESVLEERDLKLSRKEIDELRKHIMQDTHVQPEIQPDGRFLLYSIDEDDVMRLAAKLIHSNYARDINYHTSGKFNFNRMRPGRGPSQYYTITGWAKPSMLSESYEEDIDGYKVYNVSDYAADKEFIVARYSDGELWYYGAYDDEDTAEKAASEVSNAKVIYRHGYDYSHK